MQSMILLDRIVEDGIIKDLEYYQFLGSVCLFIMSKLEDIGTWPAHLFAHICCNQVITSCSIRDTEIQLLDSLKWDFRSITPFCFLPHMLEIIPSHLVQIVLDTSPTMFLKCECEMYSYAIPSSVKAISIVTVVLLINGCFNYETHLIECFSLKPVDIVLTYYLKSCVCQSLDSFLQQ